MRLKRMALLKKLAWWWNDAKETHTLSVNIHGTLEELTEVQKTMLKILNK